MHSTAVAHLDFLAIGVKLVSTVLGQLPYDDLIRLRRAQMSTPIPHFRNFKGHGYDLGQNSWFEFSIADFNFQIQHLNFTAEFKNLYSSFRIHIIGKRFYPCRLAFKLNFFI